MDEDWFQANAPQTQAAQEPDWFAQNAPQTASIPQKTGSAAVEPPKQGGVLSGVASAIGSALNPINIVKGALDIGQPSDISQIYKYGKTLGEIVTGKSPDEAIGQNIPELQQQREAVYGKLGATEQAKALTGIGLQLGMVALPFLHGKTLPRAPGTLAETAGIAKPEVPPETVTPEPITPTATEKVAQPGQFTTNVEATADQSARNLEGQFADLNTQAADIQSRIDAQKAAGQPSPVSEAPVSTTAPLSTLKSTGEGGNVVQPVPISAAGPSGESVAVGAQNPEIGVGGIESPVNVVNLKSTAFREPASFARDFSGSSDTGYEPTNDIIHPSLKGSITDSGAPAATKTFLPPTDFGSTVNDLSAQFTGLSRDARESAVVLVPAKYVGLENSPTSFAFRFENKRLVPTGLGAIDLPLSSPGILPLEMLSADKASVHNYLDNIPLKKGYINAAETWEKSKNRIAEHPGVPQGSDLPAHAEEVRQVEGERAGDSGSIQPAAQEQVAQEPTPVPEAEAETTDSSIQKEEEVSGIKEPTSATVPTETGEAKVSDDQHVSTIANKFTEERTASGELGEIAPGQGYSTKEMAAQGLKMSPEEINQHVSDLMHGTGDPIEQGKAVRAEEARLSQRSNALSRAAAADPTNVEAKLAADNAFKDVTDFYNGPVAKLKTIFHATGVGLQGELPLDLSTFNGMREKFLKDTGKPPTPEQEPQLKAMADKVDNSVKEDNGAKQSLGQAIDKATARRKLPTYDEVRQNIADRMKIELTRIKRITRSGWNGIRVTKKNVPGNDDLTDS